MISIFKQLASTFQTCYRPISKCRQSTLAHDLKSNIMSWIRERVRWAQTGQGKRPRLRGRGGGIGADWRKPATSIEGLDLRPEMRPSLPCSQRPGMRPPLPCPHPRSHPHPPSKDERGRRKAGQADGELAWEAARVPGSTEGLASGERDGGRAHLGCRGRETRHRRPTTFSRWGRLSKSAGGKGQIGRAHV